MSRRSSGGRRAAAGGLAAVCALTLAVGASAAVVTNERTTEVRERVNTCNGEEVVLTGTVHTVTKQKKDGTRTIHANFHGSGVGSQGNEYVLNSAGQAKESAAGQGARVRAHENLVSKGKAPNQRVTVLIDISGGTVTIDIEVHCRGAGTATA